MNRHNNKSHFGSLLEAYRKERGLNQSRLGREMSSIGYPLSHSAISQYERGEHRPSPRFIYFVSLCLKLTADQTNALAELALADMTLDFLSEWRRETVTEQEGQTANRKRQRASRVSK